MTKTAPTAEPAARDRLLRMGEVMEATGLSKAMIYRLIGQQRFPQQYKPGGYASRWSENEVRAWVKCQRGAVA